MTNVNIEKLRDDLCLSYSRLSLFFRCPYLYNEKYILKTKNIEKPSPAMHVGINEHRLYEAFIKRNISYEKAKKQALSKKRLNAFIRWVKDEELTFTMMKSEKHFKVTLEDFDVETLAILDVCVLLEDKALAYVMDFKSGNFHADHFDQLEFYSYVIFKKYPVIETVKSYVFGMRDPYNREKVFTREYDFADLETKIRKLLAFYEKYDSCKDNLPRQENISCWSCLLDCKHSKVRN